MQALPRVARAVSSNPDAYVYLAESIRAWPDQADLAHQISRGRVVGGAVAQPHRRHRRAARRLQGALTFIRVDSRSGPVHLRVPPSGPMTREFLWYIPNTVLAGHRGDDTVDGWGSLEYSVELALRAESSGFGGALIGTGWGRPDSFAIATAIAARTTTFAPLVAIRPGYWNPAHFASAAATLDQLSRGRLLVNVVTGADNAPCLWRCRTRQVEQIRPHPRVFAADPPVVARGRRHFRR